MDKIVLVGGGGHARVLVDLIVSACTFKIVGIIDKCIKKGTKVHGCMVLGDDNVLEEIFLSGTVNACLAVGSVRDNKLRKTLYKKITGFGYRCPSLVHPKAVVADDVSVGNGVQIMAGAIVQPGVRIGDNTIINTGAIIDHDCVIGGNVHVGPGAVMSGGCKIGNDVFVGVGSTIIQGVNVGDNVLVAAGSVVVRDIEKNQTARGVQGK